LLLQTSPGRDAVTGREHSCRRRVCCALGAALALFALTASVHAEPQVLIVFDEDKDLPGLAIINSNLQQVLRSQLREPVEIYTESLNLSRFNNPDYPDALEQYFQRKYQDRRPDLIVAVMEPALDFLIRRADTLFRGVPIVFCGADPLDVEAMSLPDNVTGVVMKRSFAPTLDVALRLQPATRNVFVVGGSSRFDRHLQAIARRDLQRFEKRVHFTWLTEQSRPQLLSELSALPADSVIYYLTVFADQTGEAFVPHEVLSDIARCQCAGVRRGGPVRGTRSRGRECLQRRRSGAAGRCDGDTHPPWRSAFAHSGDERRLLPESLRLAAARPVGSRPGPAARRQPGRE